MPLVNSSACGSCHSVGGTIQASSIPAMGAMNSLRRTADRSRLRKLFLHPKVRSAAARVAALRFARALAAVEQPASLVKSIMRGTQRGNQSPLELVTIKHSNVRVAIPTQIDSLELLDEIFINRCYEPPLADHGSGSLRILDVGANCGVFAAYALTRWPDASITCIEPDPGNLRALRILEKSNPQADLRIIEGAATTFDGEVRFLSGLGAGSMVSDKGELTPALDFFALAPQYDLVKLDIERGEWSILEDPRLRNLEDLQLVMEYHRRFAGDKEAGDTATRLLTDAGFTLHEIQPNYWGHGLIKASKASPSGPSR